MAEGPRGRFQSMLIFRAKGCSDRDEYEKILTGAVELMAAETVER